MRPVLQPGNVVVATWRARLEDHLGSFVLEPLRLAAGALIGDALALAGLATLAAEFHLLPEREPHGQLYAGARLVVDNLGDQALWPALLARLELRLLADLGFGLDLESCAATGERSDLVWVSPRTGKAVSAKAGEPWRDRLLALPAFLQGQGGQAPEPAEILAAFELTGHFLHQRVFHPRRIAMPVERTWITDHLRGLG